MKHLYPDWTILHIPHDSNYIPSDLRDHFLLSDEELETELLLMTDADTKALFNAHGEHNRLLYAPISRLVLDVERFVDDAREEMSQKGMGVVYTKTAYGRALRRELQEAERKYLIQQYYEPHHKKFEMEVDSILNLYGHCLVLDCHSFPSKPLPYEPDQNSERPDICIGVDLNHTSDEIKNEFMKAFQAAGYRVSINMPFSGSIVPNKYFNIDGRVQSVMVEVNRKLYMDESNGKLLDNFAALAKEITNLCLAAITRYLS